MTLHRFVTQVLRTNAISKDRVHAAVQLSQFPEGPEAVLDVFAQEIITWRSISDYLVNFREGQIKEVLELMVSLLDKTEEEIKEILMKCSWVSKEYFVGKNVAELWCEKRIRDFITNVCKNFKLEFPESYRFRSLHLLLGPQLQAYKHGETEDEDFFHMMSLVCQRKADMMKIAVEYVMKEVNSLGKYLAERSDLPVSRAKDDEVKEPACQTPYNRPLHKIGKECKEVKVIQHEKNVKELVAELKASRTLAAVVHMCPKLLSSADEVDMLVIRTKSRDFAVLPKVHVKVLESVGAALREFGGKQTVCVHRGKVLLQFCLEVFRWEPANVIDAFEVCLERNWGLKGSLDLMTNDIVGGDFCRRAWWFYADHVPGPTIMEHRLILVSLIFEFGLKEMRKRSKLVTQPAERYSPMEDS